MDEEERFKSATDLYNRVLPALQAKVLEMAREKLTNIEPFIIWEYCSEFLWKDKKDLRIYNIVSDIMNVDELKIYNYYKRKMTRNDN